MPLNTNILQNLVNLVTLLQIPLLLVRDIYRRCSYMYYIYILVFVYYLISSDFRCDNSSIVNVRLRYT